MQGGGTRGCGPPGDSFANIQPGPYPESGFYMHVSGAGHPTSPRSPDLHASPSDGDLTTSRRAQTKATTTAKQEKQTPGPNEGAVTGQDIQASEIQGSPQHLQHTGGLKGSSRATKPSHWTSNTLTFSSSPFPRSPLAARIQSLLPRG